jgi:glutamate synthase domain-containing protein 3
MTGGELFVFDPEVRLPGRMNSELVDAHRLEPDDVAVLRGLVERHAELTGSPRAEHLLGDLSEAARSFWRVAAKADVAVLTRKSEGSLKPARA